MIGLVVREMTQEQWTAEAIKRFGKDPRDWKFICPVCGHVASVRDWRNAGAPEGQVAFSCIGRNMPNAREAIGGTGPGPCNYAGGGLFKFNPVTITGLGNYFDFAPMP